MHLKRSFFISIFFVTFVVATGGIFLPRKTIAETDPCSPNIANETKAQLQADLDACNAEIAKWNDILANTKKNTASYATEVSALTAKIKSAQANINAKNIAIANLGKNITEKQSTINKLNEQIEKDRQSLAGLLRKTKEIDSFTLAEAMLSNQALSDFFADVDAYAATQESLQAVEASLRNSKNLTQAQKEALQKQKDDQAAAKAAIEQAKAGLSQSQAQQKALLTSSQNQEKTFSQVIAEKQAKAAQIKAALFPLAGVDSQIQFGTALEYATAASRITGVRPALILGILQQESNLGANVGSCVITDLSTGATKSITSGRVFLNGIHPTRDLPLLQDIVKGLGRDPLTTKVSCPIGVGYGGAMGPTQFIPSTWKIIEGKVESALQVGLADPWNPRDAIYATAFMLSGDGAGTQLFNDERNAACRYYSGRTCAAGPGASYGNQVMSKTAAIQQNIDALSF